MLQLVWLFCACACAGAAEQPPAHAYLLDRAEPCADQHPTGATCLRWKTNPAADFHKAPPITFTQKLSLASGYDLRYSLSMLRRRGGGLLPNVMYTWDPELATASVSRLWDALRSGCAAGQAHPLNPSKECIEFVQPQYGMWSGFRDIQDHFIDGLCTGQPVHPRAHPDEDFPVLWGTFQLNSTGARSCRGAGWCQNARPDRRGKGTGSRHVTEDHHGTRDRLVQSDRFLQACDRLWDTLRQDARLLAWKVSGDTANPRLVQMSAAEHAMLSLPHRHSLRTGAIRSILGGHTTMLQPTEDTATRAMTLLREQNFSKAAHLPMLAIHIRRTDKAKDGEVRYYYAVTNRTTPPNATLGRFRAVIGEAERKTGVVFKSYLLLSDDKRYYVDSVLDVVDTFFSRGRGIKRFLGDYTKRAREVDCDDHDRGNDKCMADHTAIAASVLAASKFATYIAGMGGSGVSQAIAQRIAARNGISPNYLSLWEEPPDDFY